jgi:hypothetical protein
MCGTIVPHPHMTSWHVKKKNFTLRGVYCTDAEESTDQNYTTTTDYINISIACFIPRFSYFPLMVEKCAVWIEYLSLHQLQFLKNHKYYSYLEIE